MGFGLTYTDQIPEVSTGRRSIIFNINFFFQHPCIASPADPMDHDGFSCHIKQEPRSPACPTSATVPHNAKTDEAGENDDLSIMLSSSKFAPLSRLYSDNLPPCLLYTSPSPRD